LLAWEISGSNKSEQEIIAAPPRVQPGPRDGFRGRPTQIAQMMKSLLSGVAMRLKLEDELPGQKPALLLMQEGSHMTGFCHF
jgi:hypothetical protein